MSGVTWKDPLWQLQACNIQLILRINAVYLESFLFVYTIYEPYGV